MIDMHSHILPNVDDGSRTIQETINLLIEAKSAGFKKIVVTPHYKKGQYEIKKNEIELLTLALDEKLKIKETIGIELIVGNEIYIDASMIEDILQKQSSRINNTRYVLFEIPFNQKIVNIENLVDEMKKNGLVPILAHPERYDMIQKNPDIIKYFKEIGMVIQSNYCSILGDYGSEAKITMKQLLKKGYVDILGSDAHREGTIYRKIKIAKEKIIKIAGKEEFQKMTQIKPQAILDNEIIR